MSRAEKTARILKALEAEEAKIGRPMKLRRYLAQVNPSLVESQGLVRDTLQADEPLDAKTVAIVNLAAALASRVPLCIRNNMTAAQKAGVTAEEIGSIMAHVWFITGTAVLSASVDGLEAILPPAQ